MVAGRCNVLSLQGTSTDHHPDMLQAKQFPPPELHRLSDTRLELGAVLAEDEVVGVAHAD